MKAVTLSLAALGFIGLPAASQAADQDFTLTYHVERIPAAKLSIDTCGSVVSEVAEKAGLGAALQSFPGQLVTVQGGTSGSGAFVVQCIAVDATTVAVVQGFDYQSTKGPLGDAADQMIAALKAEAE
ncbi:hypothetical protein C8J35_11025 [Rhizobium sp. PP-F2F-G38]|uniref:Uncharacterized protein n=1 Tax=Ferranicluibacter rubi TaxID=2715133 RepID=A0AA43ZFR1_9HYPH|nr:DUF6180 family protein [Ferranicluibacter rubi]NHT75601.1 hypothetical protein [Ferranicluibacter rubi]PYE30936.1 hypothetical protein C8J37_11459 [Rhizobium sp. PP-WC-1G-195]PYE94372.1 hypothetical protein C8J35_11025 [Rhizobium sp. PP-F2F-G38]TCQ08959.1 hypothetical protein C8J34_103347 [Rhizobium sp. PP-F2F-G36]